MKKLITILALISILIVSGCIEQENTNNKISRSIIQAPNTQAPNTSILENISNLEKIRDNQSIELLISIFNDKDERIQQRAMGALINIGEPSVEPLIQSLKSPSPDVRLCSIFVLGEIGDKRAIEPVKKLLNDNDKNVQIEARSAYNKLVTMKIDNKSI